MPLDTAASVALDPNEGQQTGTIKWADARSFASFREIGAAEVRAVRKALAGVGLYQFASSVAEKGEDTARLHVGLSGQGVADAFTAEGLDPWRYGFMCADPIFVTVINNEGFSREPVIDPTTGKQAVRLGLRHDQFMLLALAVLFAGESNELLPERQLPADRDGDIQPGADGGDRSGDGGAGSAVLNEELEQVVESDDDALFSNTDGEEVARLRAELEELRNRPPVVIEKVVEVEKIVHVEVPAAVEAEPVGEPMPDVLRDTLARLVEPDANETAKKTALMQRWISLRAQMEELTRPERDRKLPPITPAEIAELEQLEAYMSWFK